MYNIKDLKDLKLTYEKKLDVPNKIYFGTEFEFANVSLELLSQIIKKQNLTNWKVKIENDTTQYLSNNPFTEIKLENCIGGEISSPILLNENYCWDEIEKILKILRQVKAGINQKCSFQINYSINILGDNYTNWLNFIKLYTLYEHVIFYFTKNAFYETRNLALIRSKPLKKIFIDILKKKYLNQDIDHKTTKELLIEFQYSKKYALNIRNIDYFYHEEGNSIEFRMPNATLNEEIVQNTYNFFTHFIIYCTSKDFDYELIDYKLNKLKVEKNAFKPYRIVDEVNTNELINLIYKNEKDKLNFLLQYYNINLPNDGIVRKK